MFECYDKIIGFTEDDCNCQQAGRPADYAESKSGLFLDGITQVASLVGLAPCDSDIWKVLTKGRDEGTRQFVGDTNALLAKAYRLQRKALKEEVLGQVKHKDVHSPDKNYAVVTMECAPVKSGYMTLNKIGGVFSGTGDVTVHIKNNLGDTIGTPFVISTTPDTYSTVDVNLELPLYSKYLKPLRYHFYYLFEAGNEPKATELDCGCGNWKPNFSYSNPYYLNVGGHKSAPWADYVMVGGHEIDSVAELDTFDDDTPALSRKMYGLSFDVDFGCKVNEVVCKDAMDFNGNPLALSVAMAIRFATAIHVGNELLKSDILTRPNMLARDEWEEAILEWKESYAEHVNYIVGEIDYTANDCLECKDVEQLTSMGLFA